MTNITLCFSQNQLAIIDSAIQNLPHRLAAPLIADINNQIQKQLDKVIGNSLQNQTLSQKTIDVYRDI